MKHSEQPMDFVCHICKHCSTKQRDAFFGLGALLRKMPEHLADFDAVRVQSFKDAAERALKARNAACQFKKPIRTLAEANASIDELIGCYYKHKPCRRHR